MKFLIRDDDTCAFTQPEELISCYGHIWDKHPVNLSVTPFRIPGNDSSVPSRYRGKSEVMPLAENHSLVELLKEQSQSNKVHIALHGYNHTKPNRLPEYVGGGGLLKKTREGKEYLQTLLDCKIDTFVPPNNGITREGINALIVNKLHLIGLPSLIRKQYRHNSLSNYLSYLKIKYYQTIYKIQYPYIVNISGHQEVSYYSVTPSQTMDKLLYCFSQCRKLNGIFIFSTHYHAFDKRLKSGEYIRDVLDIFIEMASSFEDIEFCTYEQLWKK